MFLDLVGEDILNVFERPQIELFERRILVLENFLKRLAVNHNKSTTQRLRSFPNLVLCSRKQCDRDRPFQAHDLPNVVSK